MNASTYEDLFLYEACVLAHIGFDGDVPHVKVTCFCMLSAADFAAMQIMGSRQLGSEQSLELQVRFHVAHDEGPTDAS